MRVFSVLQRKQSRRSNTGTLESFPLYTDSAIASLQLPACYMRAQRCCLAQLLPYFGRIHAENSEMDSEGDSDSG